MAYDVDAVVQVILFQSAHSFYAFKQNIPANVADGFYRSTRYDDIDWSLAWCDAGVFLVGRVAWRGSVSSKPLERVDAHAYTCLGYDALGNKCIEIFRRLSHVSFCDFGLALFLHA